MFVNKLELMKSKNLYYGKKIIYYINDNDYTACVC